MKQLILVVSFLTLVGGLGVKAQPVQGPDRPEGNPRGEITDRPEMLPPEAINMSLLEGIKYPAKAYRKNIEGEVKIRIMVDAGGNYVKHEVMLTPDAELAELVCSRVPDLRFSPALSGSTPVDGWTAISVFFTIPNDARARQAGQVKVGY